MTAQAVARVDRGVPAGGQFAPSQHPEPRLSLAELAAPLAQPAGARVRYRGQYGTIDEAPDAKDQVTVRFDDGWTVKTKARDVVNWDAYLDMEMPAVSYDPGFTPETVAPEEADRFLHANLTGLRNGLDSWKANRDPYFYGRAAAHAEVAASLLDRDSDPEDIQTEGVTWMTRPVALDRVSIREHHAAPLSALRTRRLTGHFFRRAADLQTMLDTPGHDYDAQKDLRGRLNVYAEAAVRFSHGADRSVLGWMSHEYLTTRMLDVLGAGEKNADTALQTTWE